MSFFDDLLGRSAADASNAAAQDTYGKQRGAISGLYGYADQLPGRYNELAGAYDPYTQAGTGALSRLMAGLGLGGGAGDQEAFTRAYQSLPGYLSGLNTGTNAALRQANASGMGGSGAALKALTRFGSDYENQRVGDYLSRLMGVSGQGLQATGAATGLRATGIGQQTGLHGLGFGGEMNAAKTIGEGMVAGEQARQKALGNLLSAGSNVLGSFLGGGGGGKMFSALGSPGGYEPGAPAPREGTGFFRLFS